MSRPMRTAYTAAPANVKPVALCTSNSTCETGLCLSGTTARTPTMTATPARCHHALTSDSTLTRLTPNVLSSPCAAMITRNVRNVFHAVTVIPVVRLRNAIVVVAAPKSIAAVTATSPRKLNQPTNQAHAGLLRCARAEAHQYRAPAVGYTEQTSAMASATSVTMPPTKSQPTVMDSG